MAKKSSLPRLEILVIIIFFIAFSVWAMRKCSSDREQYNIENPTADQIEEVDTAQVVQNVDTIPAQPQRHQSATEIEARIRRERRQAEEANKKYTPLYVTLEHLNMRENPGLNSKIVGHLKLYDEVEFLNEVTDTLQEINLGKKLVEAPWIKVKNDKGKEGWVYGAGVHYYKMKLEGVE